MGSVDLDANRKDGGEIDAPARMHTSRALRQQQADPAVEETEWLPAGVGNRHAEAERFLVDRNDANSERLEGGIWNNTLEISDRV